jgi:hypothetical protein
MDSTLRVRRLERFAGKHRLVPITMETQHLSSARTLEILNKKQSQSQRVLCKSGWLVWEHGCGVRVLKAITIDWLTDSAPPNPLKPA